MKANLVNKLVLSTYIFTSISISAPTHSILKECNSGQSCAISQRDTENALESARVAVKPKNAVNPLMVAVSSFEEYDSLEREWLDADKKDSKETRSQNISKPAPAKHKNAIKNDNSLMVAIAPKNNVLDGSDEQRKAYSLVWL